MTALWILAAISAGVGVLALATRLELAMRRAENVINAPIDERQTPYGVLVTKQERGIVHE